MSYHSQYKALIKRVQVMYKKPVQAALQAQINYFITEFKRNPMAQPNDLPKGQIERVIKALYLTCGLTNAKMVSKDVKRSLNGKKNNQFNMERKAASEEKPEQERWRLIINEYYDQFLLDKIVNPITETTANQIRKVIAMGLQEGWGVDKMVRELRSSDLTDARAELIVRTETMRAANAGAMVAAAETGIAMRKEWIATEDDRTRRIPRDNYDHLHMHGIQVDFSEGFVVPSLKNVESLMFPGDPAASAGNVCNCRCTVAFLPYRDELGLPIRLDQNNSPVNSNIFLLLARKVDELRLLQNSKP